MATPGLSESVTTTQRNREMPVGPTKTKADKAKVVSTEMHKFKEGDLHSGSKSGPVVTNPKQAVAIALSESGQSRTGSAKGSHGYGHPAPQRHGHHRSSGHAGAHRIGKR